MGLNDGMLWEVQWHPGGGGSVRRLVLTRRGLRRTLIGLGFAGFLVLVVVSALPVGLKGLLTSFTVDAATRENHALKVQGDSLREQTLAAAGRAYGLIQRGRRAAWALGVASRVWEETCPAPPRAGDGDREILDWVSASGDRLDTLGSALVAAQTGSTRCPLPGMPLGPPLEGVNAVPVSLFGWRQSPFTGKTVAQYGTILAAPEGNDVHATGAGRVLFAGGVRERKANEWTRFGNLVVIDHGGDVTTVFAHLRDVLVKRGQTVARGDRLGTVGQSGWTQVPALYYELRWPVAGGSRPIDPGMVTISLPVDDIEARFGDPTGGLPGGWALLDHLVGSGLAKGPAHRPVRHDPQPRPRPSG